MTRWGDHGAYQELNQIERSRFLTHTLFGAQEKRGLEVFEMLLRTCPLAWRSYQRRRVQLGYLKDGPLRFPVQFFGEWTREPFPRCPLRFFRRVEEAAVRNYEQVSAAKAEAKKEKPDEKPSWIEVFVFEADDKPVPDLKYELTLSDKSLRKGNTDQEGRIFLDPVPSGSCKLKLGPQSSASTHTVEDGDCLQSLASKQRINPLEIWKHSKNEELFKKRKNPHILNPGDKVYLPDGVHEEDGLGTGQTHEIRFGKQPCELRLCVDVDELGFEKQLEYKLELEDGSLHQGRTSPHGQKEVMKFEISAAVKKGKLTIVVDAEDPEQNIEMDISLGALCPAEETRGLQARLFNLGYKLGEIDGERGPKTEKALEKFRREIGASDSESDGELLEREHRA